MAKQTYLIPYKPKHLTRYFAVEVSGEPVTIENTSLEIFVHRALSDELEPNGAWRVAEKTTGSFFAEGKTRKAAIRDATDRISRLDADQLSAALKLALEKMDISKLDILRYDEATDTWIPTPQTKTRVTP